jgi:hypothetical protein
MIFLETDPWQSATIWVTDHYISQRIGLSLKMGMGDRARIAVAATANPEQIKATPVHIGYGILRGMEKVAALASDYSKDWFHLDLGYTNPSHFAGNYRIGYKGTQSLYDENFLSDQSVACADWKGGGSDALICPPTDHVVSYFKLDADAWLHEAEELAARFDLPAKIRRKGDAENLGDTLAQSACVISFNSSVAWQALQKGIPAFSDITRSTVGSWHGVSGMKSLAALKVLSRVHLFRFMRGNELSLVDIQQGKIFDVLRRYQA